MRSTDSIAADPSVQEDRNRKAKDRDFQDREASPRSQRSTDSIAVDPSIREIRDREDRIGGKPTRAPQVHGLDR